MSNVRAAPAWRLRSHWLQDAAKVHADEAMDVAAAIGFGRISGHCPLCDRPASFKLVNSSESLREGLLCEHCRCNARQRAATMALLDALPDAARARVYATEQASALFIALRRRVGTLLGGEFGVSLAQRLRLTMWLWRQGAPVRVQSRDVTKLRMDDATLAGVISLEVLEHVPDFGAALREFARVLQPDGVLVLTVPFYDRDEDSVRIAQRRADGSIEHNGPPEFHGDPVSDGALCFHHFGWDLLASLRAAGFSDAQALRVQSMQHGLPQGQWVLRARR